MAFDGCVTLTHRLGVGGGGLLDVGLGLGPALVLLIGVKAAVRVVAAAELDRAELAAGEDADFAGAEEECVADAGTVGELEVAEGEPVEGCELGEEEVVEECELADGELGADDDPDADEELEADEEPEPDGDAECDPEGGGLDKAADELPLAGAVAVELAEAEGLADAWLTGWHWELVAGLAAPRVGPVTAACATPCVPSESSTPPPTKPAATVPRTCTKHMKLVLSVLLVRSSADALGIRFGTTRSRWFRYD
jgi:hypothetical protein